MNPCTCGHDRAHHAEKMAREGAPRNVSAGCLYSPPDSRNTALCPCEKFVEDSEPKGVTIDPLKELSDVRRTLIGLLNKIDRALGCQDASGK